jgi:hypothetical protein
VLAIVLLCGVIKQLNNILVACSLAGPLYDKRAGALCDAERAANIVKAICGDDAKCNNCSTYYTRGIDRSTRLNMAARHCVVVEIGSKNSGWLASNWPWC